jgi:ComF family protein
MSVLTKILFWLKNYFFPSGCVLCGCSFFNVDEIRYGLCCRCRACFDSIQGNKCTVCGKPLISENETCIPCRSITNRSYDQQWVLFPYTGKYRKMLTAYKFGGRLVLADFFAEKVMDTISDNSILKDAAIVPVPPRPGKIKMNGWDQVDYLVRQMSLSQNANPWFELFWNRLKKLYKKRGISCCLKRRKSKVQKYLNRNERIENLKGRIYLKSSPPKNVLIIDDIITTGSTMEVCASVLREGGAQKIYGLCLFYD